MKFSGFITNGESEVHAKGQGQRSKVKVTEVTTQLNCFRTVTLIWIHIWWWNDAYSLMLFRRGALASIPWPGWYHQMETFSTLLALCAGSSPVTDELPSQRPVARRFMCSLIMYNTWPNTSRCLIAITWDTYIEAEAKWRPLTRHFQLHFLEWKCMNFDQVFTEVCSTGPINDIPILVQVMAWRRYGGKPLSEPMIANLLTHIWVNQVSSIRTLCWYIMFRPGDLLLTWINLIPQV